MADIEKPPAISRTLRKTPPAHYLLKVNSVSVLLNTNMEKYESRSFEVGGYKWRLCLYPNGNKKADGQNHLSLYLEMPDTDNLPIGWEVTVNFKLFLFNHINENYLTVQDADGKVRHFNVMKTRCGFSQFLSLDALKDPCNGYLMDDSCIFGAEVSVIRYGGRGERLSVIKNPADGIFTWVIENFSKRNEESISSEIFTLKDINWNLVLFPKGSQSGKNKSLSLFLKLASREKLRPGKLYAEFKLSIKDQSCSSDENIRPSHSKSASMWFSELIPAWGYPLMISLNDLHENSDRFLLNDTLIVGVKINLMIHSKIF